jgi:aminodeoxyfutalosine deaminase
MESFIDELPKAELHLHLVGSASAPTVLELARRHPDGDVPQTEPELRAFFEFRDFPHFADVYGAVSAGAGGSRSCFRGRFRAWLT